MPRIRRRSQDRRTIIIADLPTTQSAFLGGGCIFVRRLDAQDKALGLVQIDDGRLGGVERADIAGQVGRFDSHEKAVRNPRWYLPAVASGILEIGNYLRPWT